MSKHFDRLGAVTDEENCTGCHPDLLVNNDDPVIPLAKTCVKHLGEHYQELFPNEWLCEQCYLEYYDKEGVTSV